MLVETNVFGGNKRVDNIGANVFELYFGTILNIVAAQQNTVSAVNFGCYLILYVTQGSLAGYFDPHYEQQKQRRAEVLWLPL